MFYIKIFIFITLTTFINSIQATTYISPKPFTMDWKKKLSPQSYSTNQVEKYPDFNFTAFDTSNNLITDILVFYTPSAVKQVGSVEALYRYIDDSLLFANEAYKNSHIPITRRISAILPYPYKIINQEQNILDNLDQLANDLHDAGQEKYKFKYGASYITLFQGYNYTVDSKVAGVSFLGGQNSAVTTYQRNGVTYARTFSHELGHSDGLGHAASEISEIELQSMVTPYAVGASCGPYKSIMSNEAKDVNVPFFSSPNIIYKNETPCGTVDVADNTYAYLSNIDLLINPINDSVFRNNIPPIKRVGTVSFTEKALTISEAQGSVDVFFDWVSVPLGASVEVYIEYDTAMEDDIPYFSTRITNDGSSFLTFDIMNNTLINKDKTAHLSLRYPVGVNLVTTNTLPLTVTSDEVVSLGRVKFEAPELTLNESENKTVTITRFGGSDGAFTLNLTVTLDTASQADFKQITKTIEFADKETSKTFTITALTDTLVETNETFTVTLNSTADVLSTQNTLAVKIINKAIPITPPKKTSSGGSTGVFFYLLLVVALLIKRTHAAITFYNRSYTQATSRCKIETLKVVINSTV